MRASVRAAARAFTTRYEGEVAYMYADSLGLVTCGIGNLIDPISAALALPWVHRDTGAPATADEIAFEWRTVKSGRIAAWQGKRPLLLTPDALERLFFGKLDQNEVYLARRFARWNDFPADAQLGCHSNAWAAGAAWRAPLFDAAAGACTAEGFDACAGSPGTDGTDPTTRGHAWLRDTRPEDDAAGIHRPTLNPGLRPRNLANQWLFHNAAIVLQTGGDPDVLGGAP